MRYWSITNKRVSDWMLLVNRAILTAIALFVLAESFTTSNMAELSRIVLYALLADVAVSAVTFVLFALFLIVRRFISK